MTAPNNIQFNEKPNQDAFALHSKKMDLEAGHLGKLFGSCKNAPLNIAGLTLLLLISLGAYLYVSASSLAADYWKTIFPLITGIFGFIFGKSAE